MKDVRKFLLANGFKKVDFAMFKNKNCSITIDNTGYAITDNSGGTMYSADFNIYWLIGALTYYGHMPKNYIQLNETNRP